MWETMAERLRFVFSVPVSPEWLPDGKVWGWLGGERDCGGRDGRSADEDFILVEAKGDESRIVRSSISVLKIYSTIPVVRTRV